MSYSGRHAFTARHALPRRNSVRAVVNAVKRALTDTPAMSAETGRPARESWAEYSNGMRHPG